MTIDSPAKINLALHILGKRADGFHELETFMVPISFGDTLEVDTVDGPDGTITLTCTNASLPCDETNLAHRAADGFFKRFGATGRSVRIHVQKCIPMGAGLGGGSSNAAAVLLAMRKLFGISATDAALADIAAELGSDVPFFIHRHPAWCRGRGEIIEPAPWKGSYRGVLVHPGFGVSTPWAYKTYAANPQQGEAGKPLTRDPITLRNDLEPPAFGKHFWLPTAKTWLREQPHVHDAMMSGSGSSVFALLSDDAPAHAEATLMECFHSEFGANLFAQSFQIEA